ncbi:hypothetical protein [Emticicia sp. SJ17W-69]|uniref:hypothetical protein n=1 Tax=Emticicia sp. SJ17W-69 TaxID=3421657 RepID=UPI003EBECDAE
MKFIYQLKYYSLIVIGVILSQNVNAQLKVGSNSTTLNSSAILEVEATNKGFLPPRVALTALTSASPLPSHVQGMVVYNTATTSELTPGIYVNDGTKWGRMKVNGDVGDNAGDFASKGAVIDASTPLTSVLNLGPVSLRFNTTTGAGNIELKHSLPNEQYYHSYRFWGLTTNSGTDYKTGSLLAGSWAPVVFFGVANTEGSTTQVILVDKTTADVRYYTINAHVVVQAQSGASPIYFMRVYKN